MTERQDKVANRAYSDVHRVGDRESFHHEPSKADTVRLLVPWIASHLRDGDRVADIAGGTGVYASLIAGERQVTVVGVDISEGVIRVRDNDPLLPENVVADMEELPFEDAAFDAAMFIAALHHVPDPLPALQEAYRVVRPGGQLFAFEPTSLRARHGNVPIAGSPHEFRLSRRWLLERTADAGFDVREVQGHRIAIRLLRPLGQPSAAVWRAARTADGVLRLLPGLDRLGEVVRLRAVKPA